MLCEICDETYYDDRLECIHHVCVDCLKEYIKAGIKNGAEYIECPKSCVCALISDEIIKGIVSDKKYEMMINSRSFSWKILICPDCLIVCQNVDDNDFFECKSCYTSFCKRCRKDHYGNCETVDDDYEILQDENIKRCPVCTILIYKEDGCNSMECEYCKVRFCWMCKKTNSQIKEEDHECDNYGEFNHKHDYDYVDGYNVGDNVRQQNDYVESSP